MIQFDHPRAGNVDMAEIAAVYGIVVLRNGLMGMNFAAVLVPVSAMLMRPHQMRMRRRPLDRQEGGQQNNIGRGTKTVLDQRDGHAVKTVWA